MISSQPRYDHFNTAPCAVLTLPAGGCQPVPTITARPITAIPAPLNRIPYLEMIVKKTVPLFFAKICAAGRNRRPAAADAAQGVDIPRKRVYNMDAAALPQAADRTRTVRKKECIR